MNVNNLNAIEQMEQFLTGSQVVAFLVASSKDECNRSIRRTLIKFRYSSLKKRSKGIVVRFLIKITGYSRQQITCLVKQFRDTGKIERQQRTYQGFNRVYTQNGHGLRLFPPLPSGEGRGEGFQKSANHDRPQ